MRRARRRAGTRGGARKDRGGHPGAHDVEPALLDAPVPDLPLAARGQRQVKLHVGLWLRWAGQARHWRSCLWFSPLTTCVTDSGLGQFVNVRGTTCQVISRGYSRACGGQRHIEHHPPK